MPAAAVIPALIVYTKIAAVKKLVVGLWGVFLEIQKKNKNKKNNFSFYFYNER